MQINIFILIGLIIETIYKTNNKITTIRLMYYYKMNQGVANVNNTGITTLIDSKATANGTLFNFALTGNISNFIALPF